MSIKTLHLTNAFHTESGGIATFYRELLKAAECLRRDIRLVVPGSDDHIEPHGRYGKIYYVEANPSRLSPGYRVLMPRHYLLPRSPIRRILATEKPDLVECCDKYTMNWMAGLLRRGWLLRGNYRPTVIGLSCERMDENVAHYVSPRPEAMPLCQFYMRHFYFGMFDHHIAVSAHVAGELQEVAHGHDVQRGVWVKPMGGDCRLFHPKRRTAAKRRWLEAAVGAPEGARLLLYVGRLVPEKNLGLLLEMMIRLENESPGEFHLVIAGEGSRRDGFERECDERIPGATCFLGHLTDRELLADIYASCDVFVHPNPGEPFGIAPLEAMASGLPLAGPASGGLTSYASARNAWLVDPEPEAYADAVRTIGADPAATAARVQVARKTAENFDWAAVTREFFQLYDELHALVQGKCAEPSVPPAFYSTQAPAWTAR